MAVIRIAKLCSIGALILCMSGIILTETCQAVGLSVTWGEVRLENLKIGASYNMKDMARKPYRVTYRGESEVEIAVEVLAPREDELKDGYEAIPDLSWVKVTNDRFFLGPGESAYSDVVITIPDDKKYFGKRYQAHIHAHSVGAVQGVIGLALTSRVMIGIAQSEETKEEMEQRKRGKLVANLSFKVMPDKIIVSDIPVGKKVDLKKREGLSLKILNPSDEKLILTLKSISKEESLVSAARGYKYTPDRDFLQLNREKITVPANMIKEVRLYFRFPDKQEYRDKKYFFVIKVAPLEQAIPVSYYVKVFVQTSK